MVLGVQAGRGLVEHVHGSAGRASLQLGGQLHALRLAAREGRGALTEAHVAQAHLHERVEVAGDARDRREELCGLRDRHVEHVRDGLALVLDLQGFAVVASAMADLAGYVHVGQEVHLDLQRAVALTGLAASALHIEGEASRTVATHLRLLCFGKKLADLVPHARVGRRIRARCPTNRALVHVHDLVELFDARDRAVAAGHHARTVEARGQGAVEDAVDQRRFTGTGHTGDGSEHAERERHIDVLQVVFARALDRDDALLIGRASRRRQKNTALARQVLSGERLAVLQELGEGPE